MIHNGRLIDLSCVRIFRGNSAFYFIVAAGFLLRLILLIFAEHHLEADEATVGIMALDIHEGKALPFFFYGNTYNGGGAVEAYLGSFAFKLFGPSEIALKFTLLMLWAAAALLFMDLCRRNLDRNKAFFSLLFFCVGTPFFLEWSLKARGGYAETVLVSIVLLWLASYPQWIWKKRSLQCLSFGVVCGIGIWMSEMLMVMMFCSTVWLLIRVEKTERVHALTLLLLGGVIGLIPLVIYNVTHDFAHLTGSFVYNKLFVRGFGRFEPLSLSHLWLSASFVLGKAWVLVVLGIVAGAVNLIRTQRRFEIGHVVLMHTVIYTFAYWLSGLRFLSLPPSRVLYALYPSLAILLSYATDVFSVEGKIKKVILIGLLAVWLIVTSSSVVQWISSGLPREAGSWRGSWGLTDGDGLYKCLVDLGVNEAYNTCWTQSCLLFAARKALYVDSTAVPMLSYFLLPESPRTPGRHAAIVLHTKGMLLKEIEGLLKTKNIPYQRSEFKNFTILSGLDSSQIHRGTGLPTVISRSDWEPLPFKLDGFN